MKYPQLVSSSTPASLQDWLEEELESRGIDGVYTRYILSLLQQDTLDLDPSECDHVSPSSKHVHQITRKECDRIKYRRGRSWERQLKGDSCSCTKPLLLDTEKRKKTAAVECLKSASEQKFGIEKLIDEVCTKLKHIQAGGAKDALQFINCSPEICLQRSNILESSLQEQAEKYYAAFPALSGKHEPLAELNPQQEIWTVWDGRKVILFTNKEEDSEEGRSDRLSTSDPESDSSEKENRNESDADRTVTQDAKKVLAKTSPSFIVPKMKIPIHKVANLSMYSPFTSSAYRVNKTVNKTDCKTEYLAERKLFGKYKQAVLEDEPMRQFDVAALPRKLIVETDTWELLASLGASTPFARMENYDTQDTLITDLASKFDSNLASIWARADAEAADEVNVPEELELSLRILSVDDQGNQDSDVSSVWAVSLEDSRNMRLQQKFGSPFQLTSVISIPNLLQSLASHATSIPSKNSLLSSADTSPFLELADAIGVVDTSHLAPKLESGAAASGEFDDVEGILFACPDRLFSASSDGAKSPYSSEYGSISPSELLVGDAQRIYHLWDEADGKKRTNNIWVNSNSMDKVVNWISEQADNEPTSCNLKVSDVWKMPFPQSCSPSRENCTITYHKGESRFVEVIPSSKTSQLPKASNVESCSTSLNLLDVTEDENLLTSPKTHFQPIHQDSSEGESVADETDIPCEEIVTTPTFEDTFLGSLTPDLLSPPPGFKRSLSSSLDELIGLAELSGLFNRDLEAGSMTNTSEILELMTKGWKPELLEDKSTSTESPCPLPPPLRNKILSYRDHKVWSSGSLEKTLSEVSLPWKWSTTDDACDPWMQGEELEDDIFEEVADEAVRDYNVKALRKELEEEGEELFRDINCLSDAEPSCKKDIRCTESATYVEDERRDTLDPEKKLSLSAETNDWEASGQALKNGDSISEIENEEINDSKSTFPLVPVDKILFSSELEDEWRKTSEPFDVQVPKKVKSKAKALGIHIEAVSQKRPCTFYLEGNCRRSDCKFSHQISSITCRFWEEGSCFKGITCPFLHGYISDSHHMEDAPSHKFTLESESDFPSLSKSGTSVGVSAKAPSKSTGRIIRPKKKKQSASDTHKRPENPDHLNI